MINQATNFHAACEYYNMYKTTNISVYVYMCKEIYDKILFCNNLLLTACGICCIIIIIIIRWGRKILAKHLCGQNRSGANSAIH